MATREASAAALPEDAVPAALDAVPFGVVVLDEHQRVAYANRTADQLLPNGLQIGEGAQWATVPQPPPEAGTTDSGSRTRPGRLAADCDHDACRVDWAVACAR